MKNSIVYFFRDRHDTNPIGARLAKIDYSFQIYFDQEYWLILEWFPEPELCSRKPTLLAKLTTKSGNYKNFFIPTEIHLGAQEAKVFSR